MVFIVPLLIAISFIGIRFQKANSAENNYLEKSTTNSIRGFFIVLIVSVGILNLLPVESLNRFDQPLLIFSLGGSLKGLEISLGGLLFVPFFFYSG